MTDGIRTELLYEIAMDAEVDDLGETPLGHRRIVRVTGGTFEGPHPRRRAHLRPLSLFHAAPGVMERLLRGETVDQSEYYFRTAPLFETAAEQYAWLNRVLAIGVGRRTHRQVCYTVHAVL